MNPLEEYLTPAGFRFTYAILRNASPDLQKKVVEHINTHKYLLNLGVQREISVTEAYDSWVEYVFGPHLKAAEKSSKKKRGDALLKEALALSVITHFLKLRLPKEEIEVHPQLSAAYLDSRAYGNKWKFFWEYRARAKVKRWSGFSVLKYLDTELVEMGGFQLH